MELIEMEELYKSGDWICVAKWEHKSKLWYKQLMKCSPFYGDRLVHATSVRLIHKSHSHILDAYLDGCEVYFAVINSEHFIQATDFMSNYCKDYSYLAVPKSLENCYCEATLSSYDKLLQYDCCDAVSNFTRRSNDTDYLSISTAGSDQLYINNQVKPGYKQVEYNNSIQNWIYCPKENEDGSNNYTPTGNKSSYIIGDVIMQKDPINNFDSYGFTADFPGAILKEVGHQLLSYVIYNDHVLPCSWTKANGFIDKLATLKTSAMHFNLTPLVPEPVYPIFKKRKRDGVVVKFTTPTTATYYLHETHIGEFENALDSMDNSWENEFPYDAERGLYHGQPVWVHEPYGTIVRFCNANNSTICDNDGDTICVGEDILVEPIPLEALQHMPFIWEQYQAFIGE